MKQRRFPYFGKADGILSAEDNGEHCPYPKGDRRHALVAQWLLVFVAFLPVRLSAEKYEPPKPIITPAELATAAAEVPVVKLDFTLPEEKNALESSDALSKRFFNQSEEMRYGGLTSSDWRRKWDLFTKALTKSASKKNLDAKSLTKCLTALNYGRNRQTMACAGLVPPVSLLPPPRATPEQIKASEIVVEEYEKKAAEENARIEKDKDVQPERYYNERLAIIPVGAYLAKYVKGDCWIIVCHWEDIIDEKQLEKLPPEKAQAALCLAHIMIWAMDVKTAEVIAYVTCD